MRERGQATLFPDRPAALPREAVLEGVLERVLYVNEENAWSVVKLVVPGRTELVTAVGNLIGIQPGESLQLRGRWMQDPKYGEQFKVESFASVKPATLVGIEKYLGSGLVPGIGKVIAARLVAAFGLETLEVIDRQPERLTEVEGIGRVRRERIAAAWIEQKQIQEVMVFLQGHGVSTTFAVRIYKSYGDRAIEVVSENPYRLATDIWGIGFKTADRIAAALGIARDSPRRAEAGVLHVLGEASDDGHVFLPYETLVEKAVSLLEIEPALLERAVEQVAAEDRVVVVGRDASEAPAAERAVYLKSLHVAETGLARLLRELVGSPARPVELDVDAALAGFEQEQRLSLAPEQREAIRTAVAAKVMVITGGPGTGKTTLVNGIIRILAKKNRRILLAAPTGRAAKRMAEATGREAKTLHRLLEYDPKRLGFKRDREQPLEADLVIVDESSMLDAVLAYGLLKAIPPQCQLVFVGDVDQLPSVGPGSVLLEVIRSRAVPVVRLRHIFRQAQQSAIVVSAHRVNEGRMPELAGPEDPESGARRDFYLVEREEPEKVLATVKHLVLERIPTRFGFDPIEEIQVLTPMHRGLVGASNLNSELQAALNPGGAPIVRGSRLFRTGDKVMQIRNNYDLEVFNGDIGRVESVSEADRSLTVRHDGRPVRYEPADLDELVLAYACSIHKAQGSEYPCVVIPIHMQHFVMLQRNLLYTGITRGRKLVVLVGSRKALALAVKNDRLEARWTRLGELLAGGGSP